MDTINFTKKEWDLVIEALNMAATDLEYTARGHLEAYKFESRARLMRALARYIETRAPDSQTWRKTEL